MTGTRWCSAADELTRKDGARIATQAHRDASTVYGDERNAAVPMRTAWIDSIDIERAAVWQRVWDTAPQEARDAARTRLSAVEASMRAVARGLPLHHADAVGGRETGLSAGTVGKWRRRYGGRRPIARLVSLLDDRFQRGAPPGWL